MIIHLCRPIFRVTHCALVVLILSSEIFFFLYEEITDLHMYVWIFQASVGISLSD